MNFSARVTHANQRVKDQILGACHSFLIPVARFLLRSGVSYREFSTVCRLAFVKVARDEFGLRGRPTNSSRISAMTGIPRKEVARIRESLGSFRESTKQSLSPLSDVLHRWHTDQRYLNPDGSPVVLPLQGDHVSFAGLVTETAGDVPVGAVRAELIRFGAIAVDDAGRVTALRREIVPDSFDLKLISAVSFSLAALASTIAYNSDPSRTSEGRIERYVQSDELPEHLREALRPVIRERVEQFAREIDDLLAAYAGVAGSATAGGSRLAVGIYYAEDA